MSSPVMTACLVLLKVMVSLSIISPRKKLMLISVQEVSLLIFYRRSWMSCPWQTFLMMLTVLDKVWGKCQVFVLTMSKIV